MIRGAFAILAILTAVSFTALTIITWYIGAPIYEKINEVTNATFKADPTRDTTHFDRIMAIFDFSWAGLLGCALIGYAIYAWMSANRKEHIILG